MSEAPRATEEMVKAARDAWIGSNGGIGLAWMEDAINAALKVMHEQSKPAGQFRVGQVWGCDNGHNTFTIREIDDDGNLWDRPRHRLPDGRFWKEGDYGLDLDELIYDAPEPQAVAKTRVEAVARALCVDQVPNPYEPIDPSNSDRRIWAYFETEARAHVVAYDTLRRLEAEEAEAWVRSLRPHLHAKVSHAINYAGMAESEFPRKLGRACITDVDGRYGVNVDGRNGGHVDLVVNSMPDALAVINALAGED